MVNGKMKAFKKWYSITLIIIFGACFLILLLRIISVGMAPKLVYSDDKSNVANGFNGSIYTFGNHEYTFYDLPTGEVPVDVDNWKRVGFADCPYDKNFSFVTNFINEFLIPLPVFANTDDNNKNTLWMTNCGFQRYSKIN